MTKSTKVYCAGPLFNDAERHEMALISQHLEAAGYKTFLPHRDGIEFSKINHLLLKQGVSLTAANLVLAKSVFSLDIFQLLEEADAVVVNLNGRVADEGAIVEGSMAWRAGKAVVLFKNDSRSLLDGSDNPMVTGLGGFQVVSDLKLLADAVKEALKHDQNNKIAQAISYGRQIAAIREATSDGQMLAKKLMQLLKNSDYDKYI